MIFGYNKGVRGFCCTAYTKEHTFAKNIMMTLYGIPNCDTTKKAMAWLKKKNIPFVFHNYKEAGISEARLKEWDKKAGWENILNKRSTTWRSLSAAQQESVKNKDSAIAVMLEHNSIIKRPVLEYKGKLVVGFDDKAYEKVVRGEGQEGKR